MADSEADIESNPNKSEISQEGKDASIPFHQPARKQEVSARPKQESGNAVYLSPSEKHLIGLTNAFDDILLSANTVDELMEQEGERGFEEFLQITNDFSIGRGANNEGETPTLTIDDPQRKLSRARSIQFVLSGDICFIYNYGMNSLRVQRAASPKIKPVLAGENFKLKEHDIVTIGALKMKIRKVKDDFYVCLNM